MAHLQHHAEFADEAVSSGTALEVLAAATDHGVLDPATHQLAVDALVNHWADNDPRALLDHAA